MVVEVSIMYVDAKARMVRAIAKVTTFVKAAGKFSADKNSPGKRAKIVAMLLELKEIRLTAESDIQVMETYVGKKLAPVDVVDKSISLKLSAEFDNLYYELVAFVDVYGLSLSQIVDSSSSQSVQNHSASFGNLSTYKFPTRKFPTFSGLLTEWQGFEDLFTSILSHAPADLSDVERFEILKTSLEGEALTLIAHIPLTSANYQKAWEVLRSRYGNKRDLARIHLDALLSPHTVKANDASSIKTLITSIQEHTAALDNLDFITRQWSPILVHIFENHLDYDLRARWEITVGDRHQPSTADFLEFLRGHVRSAEARAGQYTSSLTSFTSQQKPPQKSVTSKSRHPIAPKVLAATTTSSTVVTCPLCTKPHTIRKCPTFLSKSPTDRFQLAKKHRLCINCLFTRHATSLCPSKYKCPTCDRSHNSLLHFDSKDIFPPSSTVPSVDQPETGQSAKAMIVRGQPQIVVLLSTVLLDVVAADGTRHSIRALFDSGAQASFITEQTACVLMLKRHHSTVAISTFASSTTSPVRGQTTITVMPRGQQAPSFCADTYIVPQITGPTPQAPIVPGQWRHIQNLSLADPLYHRPQAVDLLLGADILPMLLLNGKATGKPGEPIAFETVFGWILMGPVDRNAQSNVTAMCLSVAETLDLSIRRFWELEELPIVRHLSPDERAAEEIHKKTTTRLRTRRFMVSLAFRKASPLLGPSTLRQWVSNFQVEPGLLTNVLPLMQAKDVHLTSEQKITVISFDETYVSHRICHDKKYEKVYGPHKCVQTLVARGLIGNWKQPIYYNYDTPMNKDILLKIIEELYKVGYDVVATVSDMGPTNIG
ncbi:uncharacterized protein LOC103311969 [Acyrthosiphon pisum]|uniref:Transposable element P transposase-like RNase H domain-containing protein n=1 Tax=Acyrthosiphon pisum TaxID=7029 RepID=A0A8R2NJM6_ACYPI|nr:uncharacterized protein LOC103311969 [Acyrthosiphon pisum]